MDVAAWLRGLGLEQYEQAFHDNAVDGEVLPSLTAEDLKELGVAAVGHRRRLLDAITALGPAAEPDRTVASQPDVEPEGERRQVTVLFADLAGYTALSRELDAEEVHALLGRFFERVDRLVEEHGGRVDKHIGDCVMAVFGAPVSHGNDAERAVRAALAIRDGMPSLAAAAGRDVGVHVGVAGGQVVASGTGSGRHREYTVTGQSVNLASRLTDVASTGEVLVSDAVRRALGDRLSCEELDPLTVKGFAEPVQAWRLSGLRSGTGRRSIVGRAHELGQLRKALADCLASGAGHAVHIRGEAGMGKTRLVEEFQAVAREAGFACHVGLVLDFGAGSEGDAVRALVRGMRGRGSSPQGDDAVFMNDLLGLPQPPGLRGLYDAMDNAARESGKRRALARLVEEASAARPMALVVEDVHWADHPMLSQLAELAVAISRCRTILVTTSRFEGDPLDRARWAAGMGGRLLTIDLGPLDAAAARLFARPFLEANAARAERCVERAAGNPLFLEQLLRDAEEGTETAVPGSVQSLIQARIDRLDPGDKAALQAAAVLGQRFDLEALRHVLGRPDYGIERLVERLLVRPEGQGFLFAHALIRDAVYDGLLRNRRRELHGRAAGWYERRDAAVRAEHLDRADDAGAPRAYLAAARALFAEHRHDPALRLVERGLELAREPADRFALACLQGDLLHDAGRMPAALSAYRDALTAAADPVERCRALIGIAAVKRMTDDLNGAFADLEEAEAIATEVGLVAEEARIHYLRGNLYFPRGDIDGCLREHARSLELARAAGASEQEAAALGGLGDAEYVRGRMVSAYGAYRSCVELSRQRGLGRTEIANLPMVAFTRWFVDDTRSALAEAHGAIAAAAKVGQLRAQTIAHHAGCFCSRVLLDLPEGWRHAEPALTLARQLGARRFEAEALALRAELHRLAGDRSKALADIEAALTISRETGMAFIGPVILGVLALATEDGGVRGTALAEGEALLAAGSVSHNHFLFRRDAIDACLQMGTWDAAERHAGALEDYAREEPSPWSRFVVGRGRALAAHGRGAGTATLGTELARLRSEGLLLQHLDALGAIDVALGELRG